MEELENVLNKAKGIKVRFYTCMHSKGKRILSCRRKSRCISWNQHFEIESGEVISNGGPSHSSILGKS